MKTEMQREYEQLCRIDENPGVQGLAQLGRNAINRVSRLESQLARADARIAELEREIERLDAQWREELRIYRETDGVDVERYRWLRDRGGLDPDTPWCVFQGKDWHGRNELDAAIDAARANGGEG